MRDRSSDSKSVRHGTPFGPAEFAAADGPGIGFTVSGDAVAQIATACPIATAEIPTRSDEGASAMDVTKRLDPVVRANPRTEASSAPAPARIVITATAAAPLPGEPWVNSDRPGASGGQLVRRHAGDAAGVAGTGSVQPILSAAGERGSRLEADGALPDGDPRVCRQRRPKEITSKGMVVQGSPSLSTSRTASVEPAPAQGSGRQRSTAGYRGAVVAQSTARVQADHLVPGAAVLAGAAPERSERARFVRPLARTPVSTLGRPCHIRRCRGDR